MNIVWDCLALKLLFLISIFLASFMSSAAFCVFLKFLNMRVEYLGLCKLYPRRGLLDSCY